MAVPDYYNVLGVEKDARPAQIKKANVFFANVFGSKKKDLENLEKLHVPLIFPLPLNCWVLVPSI